MAFNDDNQIPDIVPSPSTTEPILVANEDTVVNMMIDQFTVIEDVSTGKQYKAKDIGVRGVTVTSTLKKVIDDGSIEEVGGSKPSTPAQPAKPAASTPAQGQTPPAPAPEPDAADEADTAEESDVVIEEPKKKPAKRKAKAKTTKKDA